jgi:beta-N-acetylhexosaminidase
VIERLAAACVLASFHGPRAPDWILRRAGGVALFASNAPYRELIAELRAEADDLVVALDEEGGDVTRLEWREGSSYPAAAALGAVDDVALTERVAASIGSELGAVGVNLDFAPVADVNVNPDNPIIGARSFGSDPELVARHVAAFVRGLQKRGVAACAKHFPGHGATSEDSHLELPTVTGPIDDALVPFRAAVDAGVQAVMTAHIVVASLDDTPATVSPVVLGLLREELGFDGVVVSDACEMKALAATVGIEEGAVRAVAAGCDLVIAGRDLDAQAVARIEQAIVAAVRSARVPEARLQEAAARVRRLAATKPLPGDVDREAGELAARRALVVEGDAGGAVVVELAAAENFAAGRTRSFATTVVAEGDEVPVADVLVVRDAHRHPWMRAAVEAQPGAVVVELGLPLWRPPRVRGYVATYGGGRASYDAAREALQGVAAR